MECVSGNHLRMQSLDESLAVHTHGAARSNGRVMDTTVLCTARAQLVQFHPSRCPFCAV